MVVPAGMPVPEIGLPTSDAWNVPVPLVRVNVVLPDVMETPVTARVVAVITRG